MCAVPILICSHWAARGTNMVRCLAAPLSPREISQLLDLRHGKSQSDPSGFKRFIMLGLVEERPGGFAITELGRQRLDAELSAESANRGRPPLFGR
jgi:hypothetical protein